MIPDLPIKFQDHIHGVIKHYQVKYAGKGKIIRDALSSSVHVVYNGIDNDISIVVKRIKFSPGNDDSRKAAVKKAIEYCVGKKEALKYFNQ